MENFNAISDELNELIPQWQAKLQTLSREVIKEKRNDQNRTIKQIIGHMIDSATNNTHRVVHAHYRESPFEYPNYATHGNNDRWIAMQNYQEQDWELLLNVWKYTNLHYTWVIRQVDSSKLDQKWLAGNGIEVSLEEMITDFPRHFKLHLREITEIIEQ